MRCKLYDARGAALRTGLQHYHVMDQVNHLKNSEKPAPFSYLLSDQEPGLLVNTVFGNVPLGACLAYQLQDYGRPNTTFFSNTTADSVIQNPVPQCVEYPEIPVIQDGMLPFDLTELNVLDQTELTDFFVDHILINLEEARRLERRTVLQGESSEWLEQHNYRLTASNFGKVYFRVQRPSDSMLKSIFDSKDLSKVRAISHGKGKEKVARTIYARKMQQKIPGFTIFDAGISVHPSYPYLGASPDGKVFDPSKESAHGLLEIKCPFSKRGETLEQAAADASFYIENIGGKFYLKKNHAYYAQVQGQLAITGLTWCDFCVYLSESNEMCVDRIEFDPNFWRNELLPKLNRFFFMNHAIKFIVGKAQTVDNCARANDTLVYVNSHSNY